MYSGKPRVALYNSNTYLAKYNVALIGHKGKPRIILCHPVSYLRYFSPSTCMHCKVAGTMANHNENRQKVETLSYMLCNDISVRIIDPGQA